MKQIQHFLIFYEENANIYYSHIYTPPNRVHSYPSQNKVTQVREKSKHNNKQKEDTTSALRATQNVGDKDSGAWKAKRALLQQDITFLNISNRLAEKLKQAQVFFIGELARKSRTEIVALDHLTKDDLDEILKALALVDLSTCTQLSNYGLVYHQGMIGELMPVKPPEIKKVEEESDKIATAIVPITPRVTTLDGATIDYVSPPLGTGTIEYSIPLLKGDDAQLFRNVNGEVAWTLPLPTFEKVGFETSREKSLV